MKLENIKIGHSPLTDSIFLYRHGRDAGIALEKRDAEADVVSALVSHMMHGHPSGAKKQVTINGKKYQIKVTPVKESECIHPNCTCDDYCMGDDPYSTPTRKDAGA